MSESHPYQGLLFIGDPHAWSLRPGRRRDASFHKTVAGKLEQAAKICHERNLFPVILGDLLHVHDDNDSEMMVGLARALRSFPVCPLTLEGNHEKDELRLTDRNALTLLGVTGVVDIIEKAGLVRTFVLQHPDGREHTVLLGGTPYGAALPLSFEQATGQSRLDSKADSVVWITHEDLAFEGAYPGALPLTDVKDIDMVVNGHMHGTKSPVLVGKTAWYNPGNITRMSVDMADHVPSVWAWTPFDNDGMASTTGQRVPKLEQIPLQHVPANEAFDFEGRHTRKAALMETAPADSPASRFVLLMKEDFDAGRTQDASLALESLDRILETRQVAQPVRDISLDLFSRARKKVNEQ